MKKSIVAGVALASTLAGGCVTSTVDEMVFNEPSEGIGDASVVILGRRHAADYETEPDFIDCLGKHVMRKDKTITVMDELEFLNELYPWFEPRTAPLHPGQIENMIQHDAVRAKAQDLNLEYMIWVDGRTIRTDGAGSMACGIGPGGAGCFGFGTWSNESEYEAVIWDFTDRAEVGRLSTSASGQSYMPAVVVPIPIIAPVQGTACDGIGDQLVEFLSSEF